MDSDDMISPDFTELEQLLSDLADEGATAELISRLDALLLDRPDLQEQYVRATELNVLLSYELNLSLQPLLIESSRSLIAERAEQDGAASTAYSVSGHPGSGHSSPGDETRSQLAKESYAQQELQVGHRQWNLPTGRGWQIAAICASLAFVALSLVWHTSDDLSPEASLVDASTTGSSYTASASEPAQQIDGLLVVRDARSLRTLDRMTRTSSLVSLELPSQSLEASDRAILCGGSAWMERPPGQREHGYVVALQPGYSLDLFIDTEAGGQNALGVVELDQQGRMAGSTLAFNNLLEGDGTISDRRAGCIGEFSDTNLGREPKFYLFAGSHLACARDGGTAWRQSDCKVRYYADDLMVIGWDDSPYTITGKSLDPDRDYNDIRAILRFSKLHGPDGAKPKGVYYSPPASNDESVSKSGFADLDDPENYQLDVRPGEKLMLLISSSASLQNSVRLVESPSNKVIWQDDGVPDELGAEPLSDRGVYVIHNCSETVKRYQLQGRFKSKHEEDMWQEAPHRILDEKAGSTTVGFEDSLDEELKIDWNDIRVHLRWFED